jgi:uncharacterized protein YjiS (DUF1127 family)
MTRPSVHPIFTHYPAFDRLRGIDSAAGPVAAALLATVATWRLRHRTRRQLAGLDAHALRDIGIGPDQARREAGKPFWRA